VVFPYYSAAASDEIARRKAIVGGPALVVGVLQSVTTVNTFVQFSSPPLNSSSRLPADVSITHAESLAPPAHPGFSDCIRGEKGFG